MLWTQLRRIATCLVYGHEDALRTADGEMYLRCHHCRRRTVGWWWPVTGR